MSLLNGLSPSTRLDLVVCAASDRLEAGVGLVVLKYEQPKNALREWIFNKHGYLHAKLNPNLVAEIKNGAPTEGGEVVIGNKKAAPNYHQRWTECHGTFYSVCEDGLWALTLNGDKLVVSKANETVWLVPPPFIEVPQGGAFVPPVAFDSFSVTAVFTPASLHTGHLWSRSVQDNRKNVTGWYLAVGSVDRFWLKFFFYHQSKQVTFETKFVQQTPTHMVCTYDTKKQTTTLYINGKKIHEIQHKESSVLPGAVPFTVGGPPYEANHNQKFIGNIVRSRLYLQEVLSAEQVEMDYQAAQNEKLVT